jgi:hypothetical protein
VVLWTTVAVLSATALETRGLGWPSWTSDLAVAAVYLVAGPQLANTLSFGHAAKWFRRLRHRSWWMIAYLSCWVLVVGPRLGWPRLISWLAGGLALMISLVLLSEIAVRRTEHLKVG